MVLCCTITGKYIIYKPVDINFTDMPINIKFIYKHSENVFIILTVKDNDVESLLTGCIQHESLGIIGH